MLEQLLPSYDAVYVVSDLHMGGFDGTYRGETRDYRIFRESNALSWLIGWLAEPARRQEHARIALVINGDVVDYLAEEQPKYFDWQAALQKLEAMIGDREQKPVWEALRAFVASGNGDLVLVLGNHDLELALLEPQLKLRDYLTAGNPDHRGRVVFAMDGTGFACQVNGRSVLCVHGNEVDPWNAIDYSRLAMIRRALVRGSLERDRRSLAEWIPNPGTQMVIDYMNGIKRQYQWIDLLKPEEEASAMVSAAIADSPRLRTFADVMRKQKVNAWKVGHGFMGGTAVDDAMDEETSLPVLPRQAPATPQEMAGILSDGVEALARGVHPLDLVDAPDEDFLLSLREMVAKTARLKIWPRSLRDVLRETLADDKTFEPATQDDTFRDLDALCSPEWDFLIAGHTHLHRAIERKPESGRAYFNSGTWIRLAHIPQEALSDELFPEVERRLRNGSMEALEKPLPGRNGEIHLLKTVRTVVKIETDKDAKVRARGKLLTVEGNPGSWRLEGVPGTELPKRGGQ
jgi:UDP-2,3-diacylglucosamine pyrophosphatase LpxH